MLGTWKRQQVVDMFKCALARDLYTVRNVIFYLFFFEDIYWL